MRKFMLVVAFLILASVFIWAEPMRELIEVRAERDLLVEEGAAQLLVISNLEAEMVSVLDFLSATEVALGVAEDRAAAYEAAIVNDLANSVVADVSLGVNKSAGQFY